MGERGHGAGRGSAATGHRPAGHQRGDGCSGTKLLWAMGLFLPDHPKKCSGSRESGSARHKTHLRHRLAHGVAQAKIRAHSLGMQGKGNEEGWEYLQMCFEEGFETWENKASGYFCKGDFSSPQT